MTFTKSWLQKQITDLEATRDEIPFGLDEDGNNTLAALKLALAGMEAEPVGEVSEQSDGLVMDGTVDLGGKSTHRIINGASKMKRLPLGTKFYTAPPAPVVRDDLTGKSFEYIANKFQVSISDAQWVLVGWNAFRAAMLQAGKSPVIPDGWVTVPVEPTPEMREAFHIANEEAEDGLHGVWSPDHQWQAMLSAAPQQEAE